MGKMKAAVKESALESKRAAASRRTRAAILDAARSLFSERGYDKVPSKELAARAGVAEGTVFLHFPDKPSLLAAALHDRLTGLWEGLASTMPPEAGLSGKLTHLARGFYEYYAANPELARSLIKESLFLGGEWGEKIAGQALGFVMYVAGLYEQAKSAGEIDPGADSLAAARTYFAVYFLGVVEGLASPVFDVEAILSHLSVFLDQQSSGLAPLAGRAARSREGEV